ncbi:metal ABC transporter solute-binding protein, Zn/Mn family [Haloferula sp. A504]|uniref:metal ABC transporter solute-binding protein, Zn/Mn family n=1 Tax=Haloferula sp. A504 TaxID=3373601 RepID=UPI0031C1E594|nr:zinc ABC transporter substrate-binding protein [Verrucomicrobiaceae bacterium E54]
MKLSIAILGLLAVACTAAELKVATLHPLLADLAREVGGPRVEVVELLNETDDPHHFEPTPDKLRAAVGMDLCLASGKGLESYLPALRNILGEDTRLIEVGATIPSLEGGCNNPDHHHEGELDPHWWHSIDAFRRAATATAEAFAEADPDNADAYRNRAIAYRANLDALERWTRRQVARIPADRRVLATAHAAFGYFCHDFGFTALPVQGLNREQMPDAQSLAELVDRIRESGIPAIFPEDTSNPKILQTLASDIGVKIAAPLIADGTTAESYEAMVRHNVTTIVAALGPERAGE